MSFLLNSWKKIHIKHFFHKIEDLEHSASMPRKHNNSIFFIKCSHVEMPISRWSRKNSIWKYVTQNYETEITWKMCGVPNMWWLNIICVKPFMSLAFKRKIQKKKFIRYHYSENKWEKSKV